MNKKSHPNQNKREPAHQSNNGSPSDGGDGQQRPVRAMLSPRQTEVAQLVARGLSDKEIGNALNLSEETVSWHLRGVFRRFGVHSRSAAAADFVQQQSATRTYIHPPHERVG